MSVVVLNGFDRCGSSAISRTLGQHPDVELIFQPFNSGSIREKMYQILDPEIASQEDYDFFDRLRNGVIDESYIKSEWYYKYSSTRSLIPDRVHLIKTTINHFTAGWQIENFPEIPLWGIWREPESILNSILRNDFTDRWYSDALESLKPTLLNCERFSDYVEFLPKLKDVKSLTAFFIAVRSHYFFEHIPNSQILKYEAFVRSPNQELKRFCQAFDLVSADFDIFAKRDLNIIGKAYDPNKALPVLHGDTGLVDAIFAPLRQMMGDKLNS